MEESFSLPKSEERESFNGEGMLGGFRCLSQSFGINVAFSSNMVGSDLGRNGGME